MALAAWDKIFHFWFLFIKSWKYDFLDNFYLFLSINFVEKRRYFSNQSRASYSPKVTRPDPNAASERIFIVEMSNFNFIRHANAPFVKKWCIKYRLWHSIESLVGVLRIRKCNNMRYFHRKKVCTHPICETRSAIIKF
jgi:hypothetical protein